MSLITACPACQTQFEVTEAELHAYRGKVRCGECEHVFDAAAHLLNVDAGVISSQPAIDQPSENNAPVAVSPVPTFPAETAPTILTEDGADTVPVPGLTAAFAPASPEPDHGTDIGTEVSDTVVEDAQTADEETEALAPADALPAFPETSPMLDAALPEHPLIDDAHLLDLEKTTEDTTPAEPSVPEFLRNVSLSDERPPQPLPSPARQSLHLALMIVFALGICMQLLYFSRTHLAAHYPQSKPLLLRLCQLLHCEIGLPQEIAQLTIDDADIQEHRERGGVLLFSSVLMNHAQVAQAYPLIELTLTNTSDEPVLRRVLKPQEYLPATLKVADGLAAQQEIRINSLVGITDQGIAGFRVAIAY